MQTALMAAVYLILLLVGPSLVHAAPYTCSNTTCVLPECLCPSLNPPAGLSLEDTPQFVLLTYQGALTDRIATMLSELNYSNPNGCPMKSTLYLSSEYTDFYRTEQLYSLEHDIADFTMDLFTSRDSDNETWTEQINGCRSTLSVYANVPLQAINGFRAPELIFNEAMFDVLGRGDFEHDSSIFEPIGLSISPSVHQQVWPYTLDNGVAQVCWSGTCPSKTYPGLWEIPMYIYNNDNGTPFYPSAVFEPSATYEELLDLLKRNLLHRSQGNKAPMGVWLSQFWADRPDHMRAVRDFLSYAESQGVWFVTASQLVSWMRAPRKLSEMHEWSPVNCSLSSPRAAATSCSQLQSDVNQVNAKKGVVGLNTGGPGSDPVNCTYPHGYFRVCGSCPSTYPTPNLPAYACASSSSSSSAYVYGSCSANNNNGKTDRWNWPTPNTPAVSVNTSAPPNSGLPLAQLNVTQNGTMSFMVKVPFTSDTVFVIDLANPSDVMQPGSCGKLANAPATDMQRVDVGLELNFDQLQKGACPGSSLTVTQTAANDGSPLVKICGTLFFFGIQTLSSLLNNDRFVVSTHQFDFCTNQERVLTAVQTSTNQPFLTVRDISAIVHSSAEDNFDFMTLNFTTELSIGANSYLQNPVHVDWAQDSVAYLRSLRNQSSCDSTSSTVCVQRWSFVSDKSVSGTPFTGTYVFRFSHLLIGGILLSSIESPVVAIDLQYLFEADMNRALSQYGLSLGVFADVSKKVLKDLVTLGELVFLGIDLPAGFDSSLTQLTVQNMWICAPSQPGYEVIYNPAQNRYGCSQPTIEIPESQSIQLIVDGFISIQPNAQRFEPKVVVDGYGSTTAVAFKADAILPGLYNTKYTIHIETQMSDGSSRRLTSNGSATETYHTTPALYSFALEFNSTSDSSQVDSSDGGSSSFASWIIVVISVGGFLVAVTLIITAVIEIKKRRLKAAANEAPPLETVVPTSN